MNDFVRYQPDDFTVDDLVASATGRSIALAPALAVALLAAKQSRLAHDALIAIVYSPTADPRGRSSAIRALATDPAVADILLALREDPSALVAEAARSVTQGMIDDG